MRIEINPRSLLNLEQICEILYKLHPSVLDELVDISKQVRGVIKLDNPSVKEREFLADYYKEKDYSEEQEEESEFLADYYKEKDYSEEQEEESEEETEQEETKPEEKDNDFKKLVNMLHGDGDYAEDLFVFNRLLKYLQVDTYEYIPIKINIEVEDPVIGRKVRHLIRDLEKTECPEQYYLNKREMDYYAYFAEGYGLTMNEEQEKKKDDLFSKKDPEELKELLIKEKLYYY